MRYSSPALVFETSNIIIKKRFDTIADRDAYIKNAERYYAKKYGANNFTILETSNVFGDRIGAEVIIKR